MIPSTFIVSCWYLLPSDWCSWKVWSSLLIQQFDWWQIVIWARHAWQSHKSRTRLDQGPLNCLQIQTLPGRGPPDPPPPHMAPASGKASGRLWDPSWKLSPAAPQKNNFHAHSVLNVHSASFLYYGNEKFIAARCVQACYKETPTSNSESVLEVNDLGLV